MATSKSTSIRLLSTNLTPNYEHTIYFSSRSEQTAYFMGLSAYTFNNSSYQRVNKNTIRVAGNPDNYYNSNYIMFQNSAFSNKWFYGFVKRTDYINDNTCEIEYEIDVMQSYFFDYTLGETYIEREHTSTDVIGENVVPENFNIGDYLNSNHQSLDICAKLGYIVDCTINRDYVDVFGTIYPSFPSDMLMNNGIGNTLNQIGFKSIQRLYQWLNTDIDKNYTKLMDSIECIRIGYVDDNGECGYHREQISYNFGAPTSLNGYVPRNKKLLTYPYTTFYVTDLNGHNMQMPFEYFANRTPRFVLFMDSEPASPMLLYPLDYQGTGLNQDMALEFNDFPMLGWSIDTYRTWCATSGKMANLQLGLNAGTGIITGASSASISSLLGTLTSTTANGISLLQQGAIINNKPPEYRGHSSGFSKLVNNMIDYRFMTKSIRPQIARTIDDFFDKFGYACHELKTPNRNVRPHWTYTKTIGCVLRNCNLPANVQMQIENIYNNGITFWKNGENVGNYSLDNSV